MITLIIDNQYDVVDYIYIYTLYMYIYIILFFVYLNNILFSWKDYLDPYPSCEIFYLNMFIKIKYILIYSKERRSHHN